MAESAPSRFKVDRLGDLDAILARHGPADARQMLGDSAIEDLVTNRSTSVEASVVVGDLRMSAIILREAVQTTKFARFIVGFTEAVRSVANASGGWFDKFTGDGFIAYWLTPPGQPAALRDVPDFCQALLPAADNLVSSLRKTSRNFPVGVGLSLGADSGPCELVLVGESLTLVGGPIVGASRMVAGANPGQTLLNVYLGEQLAEQREWLTESGIQLERTSVKTKEYPLGQEAYELRFPGITDHRSAPHPSAGSEPPTHPPSDPAPLTDPR
jgi:class 3 adenylate cyclase